jgi:hypothetical protein
MPEAAPNEGVVLLGWKTRDEALALLQQDCEFDPPLADAEAEKLWARYREHVNALRGRIPGMTAFLELGGDERRTVDEFLDHAAKHGGPVRRVVKVNPLTLAAHQLELATARCAAIAGRLRTAADWARECLCPASSCIQPLIRHLPNSVDVELPHGEWALLFDPELGLVLGEAARCITVTTIRANPVLWSGYHRTYAAAAYRPEGHRTILAAMADDLGVAPAERSRGLRAVQSDNPPVFADFFDPRLALTVRFRAKRFTMQIRARVVASVAEPSTQTDRA